MADIFEVLAITAPYFDFITFQNASLACWTFRVILGPFKAFFKLRHCSDPIWRLKAFRATCLAHADKEFYYDPRAIYGITPASIYYNFASVILDWIIEAEHARAGHLDDRMVEIYIQLDNIWLIKSIVRSRERRIITVNNAWLKIYMPIRVILSNYFFIDSDSHIPRAVHGYVKTAKSLDTAGLGINKGYLFILKAFMRRHYIFGAQMIISCAQNKEEIASVIFSFKGFTPEIVEHYVNSDVDVVKNTKNRLKWKLHFLTPNSVYAIKLLEAQEPGIVRIGLFGAALVDPNQDLAVNMMLHKILEGLDGDWDSNWLMCYPWEFISGTLIWDIIFKCYPNHQNEIIYGLPTKAKLHIDTINYFVALYGSQCWWPSSERGNDNQANKRAKVGHKYYFTDYKIFTINCINAGNSELIKRVIIFARGPNSRAPKRDLLILLLTVSRQIDKELLAIIEQHLSTPVFVSLGYELIYREALNNEFIIYIIGRTPVKMTMLIWPFITHKQPKIAEAAFFTYYNHRPHDLSAIRYYNRFNMPNSLDIPDEGIWWGDI